MKYYLKEKITKFEGGPRTNYNIFRDYKLEIG